MSPSDVRTSNNVLLTAYIEQRTSNNVHLTTYF